MRLSQLGFLFGAVTACSPGSDVVATFGDAQTTGDTGNPTTGADDVDPRNDDTAGDGSGPAPVEPSCGNNIIDGEDVCDGLQLGETSCQSLGFETGEIGCTPNCGGYDLSDCGFFICGNGSQEGDEDCDGTVGEETCATQGYDNGTLFCFMGCEYNYERCGICGNGLIDPEEDCDIKDDLPNSCQGLGFMTGALQCGGDCLYDTSGCSTCGNEMQEGNEDCDGTDVPGKTCAGEGFDSGTLACQPNCQFDFDACGTCGNDLRDGDELCDGTDFGADSCVTQGFDSGGLGCNAACDTVSTDNCGTCGNGVIDGSEACDDVLLGGQTCAGLGLLGGDLACSATCQLDFSGCDIQGVPFGDDTGYTGLSLMPGVLPCDDISATGTDLLLGDDTASVANIGFNFTFYGDAFNSVNVSSNGTLNFNGGPAPSLANVCLPAGNEYLIAVYWDDLNPPAGAGAVRTQTLGAPGNQRFVVQWDTPNFGGDALDLMRIQVMLHEAGNIDVCYVDTINAGNTGDSGAEATAGIQRDVTAAIEFSCNAPALVDGLQLMYLPL